jgi:hypothetical protein
MYPQLFEGHQLPRERVYLHDHGKHCGRNIDQPNREKVGQQSQGRRGGRSTPVYGSGGL